MEPRFQSFFISNELSNKDGNKGQNSEMNNKVLKLTEKLTDTIYSIVNEPSIAFYRIDENVRKSVPILIEQRKEFKRLNTIIQGEHFDMEYEMSAIKNIKASKLRLKNLANSMKDCIYLKQQLDYNLQHRLPNLTNTDLLSNLFDNISLASSSFVGGISRHLRSHQSIDLTKRAKLTRSAEFSFDFGFSYRYDHAFNSSLTTSDHEQLICSHNFNQSIDPDLKQEENREK